MDALRWKQLKDIVGEAMERPPSERAAFVAAACGGDSALAAEVTSLLEHDKPTGGFLDRGAVLPGDDALLGHMAGPYRLIEEIGHGGMGTVYLAERVDGAYDQRVAVKVIRRGMDTEHVLRRFRNERQILATLNHPNIARLLDGGALPDGRPYLVMEYVDGKRIDQYCDDEALGPNERLRLFLQVCDAVFFAHQRLVVHRDIKPGNVLVDAGGTPKLLDFGIAKLLGSDGGEEVTESVLRPMTPEYASPEQITGQPVTTATDVYTLGVMLYELLTGRRPHPTKDRTTQAVLDAIRETDPLRPSAAAPPELQRRLRGDLDVILLTALRREPERRYPSAEAFAADVRRHLEGRAVLARKDSWTYRAGRFVAQNAVAVTAAVLVAGALVAGTWVAMDQARVASAERAVAEKRLNDTLRLTNSMLFELFEGIDQGPTRARQMLVDRAFGYLDQLAREAPDDPRLIHELAQAYSRLASLQGGTRSSSGAGSDSKLARASFTKAIALRERLARIAPEHYENRRELGDLYVGLGALSNIDGRAAASIPNHRKGVALLERAAAEQPGDRRVRMLLARAHFNLAQALGSSDAVAHVGRPTDALPHLAAALRINAALLAEKPDDLETRIFMVALYNENANCMEKVGRKAEGLASQQQAIRTSESLVERHPDSVHYRRELAVSYGNLAAKLLSTDKVSSLEYARKSLPLYESIVQTSPADLDAKRDLAIGHRNVAKALTVNGDPHAALPHVRKAVAMFEALTRESPDSAFIARHLAFTHLVAADTLLAAGEAVASLEEIRRGIAIGQSLMKKDASNMVALRTLAMSFSQAGRAAEALAARQPGQWAEARGWYVRSRDAWAELGKATGEMPAANVQQAEQVREAISRCDQHLGRRAT